MNHEVKVVPIEAIEIEDGFNPRQHVDDELADSIRRHGVLQPVLVRPKPDSDERWLLVDGQRRITAARKEGHKEIPVSVRADLDNNGLAAALVTALKRKDLDPVEEAQAYQRLIDGGLTKRGAAQTIGVPQKTITARLQILALPEKLRPLVAAGTIPLSAVAELARMAGFSTRLAERVGAEGASSGRFDFWVAEQIARGIKTLHPINDIDVDALKLDAAAREKIDALSDSWSKWRPRLREQDLDRARAAGVLYEEPRHRTEASWGFARAIICDTEIARELTLAALGRDWRQRQRRLAEQRRQDGKPEPGTPQHERDKQRRKKQREREQELREWARGANLDLGRKLLDTLASVELAGNRDVADLLAYTILSRPVQGYYTAESAGGAIEVWRLAARGLRYTLADWQQEERLKSGKTKIAYAGGGKTGEAREELERRFWAWFEAGKTAEQTIGRLVVALAAARYAIDEVVPASRRHWLRLPAGKDDKAAKALERLAGGHLPASLAQARKAIDAHNRDGDRL